MRLIALEKHCAVSTGRTSSSRQTGVLPLLGSPYRPGQKDLNYNDKGTFANNPAYIIIKMVIQQRIISTYTILKGLNINSPV